MKVLMAAEGSEFSRAAIEKCCEMFAKSSDAEIEIFSVYELLLPPTEPFAVSADYIQKIDDQSEKQATAVAAQAEEQIRAICPGLANRLTKKVVSGSPERAIVEEAEQRDADLIIVGSHDYGFWKRAWLGSVSNSVMQHAPCSVLVVRKKKNPVPPQERV